MRPPEKSRRVFHFAGRLMPVPPIITKRVEPTVERLQARYDAAIKTREAVLGLPMSSVEALVFSLKTHGIAAFERADVKDWLSRLNPPQIDEVVARLERLATTYPAINSLVIAKIRERAA